MLKEAMLAMRVTDMDYAPEICRLLKSAEMDLRIAGVTIEGTCAFDIAYTQDPEDPTITDITVLSYSDDRQYFSRAQSGMITGILNTQSVDVSTVSGATFSSNSILEAVADALDLDYTNPNAASDTKHSRH